MTCKNKFINSWKYVQLKGQVLDMIKRIIKRIEIWFGNRSWENKRKYLIKKGAIIGEGTRLNCGVQAFGTEPYLITCGNDCLFAGGVSFITHDGGIKVLNSLNFFGGKRMSKMSQIKIGNNVYIGQNAMIMPGVEIGNNVIIGAGAIVTHSIPDNVVAVGIPATVKKSIDEYYATTIDRSLFCFDGYATSEKEKVLREAKEKEII